MEQLKALTNIFQYCSIYLLVFFEKRPGRVTLIPLGAIDFDGFIVFDEVTDFGELAVHGGVTLSGNLVVARMLGC